MSLSIEQLRRILGPNPWRKVIPGTSPYVLPEDEALIQDFNRRARPEHEIRLDVFPEPFVGNPLAPVVILSLNPGFKESQVAAHTHPAVSRLLHRSMLLDVQEEEIPFHHLHPDYRAHSASQWWPRCLKGWIERYGLGRVSRSFLCIEFFPYASRRYRAMRTVLQSQRFSFELARARIQAGATVIALRRRKDWCRQLSGLDDREWIGVLNPQAGSLNPPSLRRRGNLATGDAERIAAAIEAAA